VNDLVASRCWPGESAIGRRIRAGAATDREWAEIVGVVSSVRHGGITGDAAFELYRPYAQAPSMPALMVAVRASGDPARLAPAVRDAIWSIDRNVPLAQVQTMDEMVARSMARTSGVMVLLVTFAGVGLTLGAIGVWGVAAYQVSRRTREIGLRVALGARPRTILAMMVGQSLRAAVLGTVLGIGAALILTRSLGGLLYDVRATDPITFAAVTALLLRVVALASALPARRAAAIDPSAALRHQ
jgi:putative ABC transport system permease protein